jgi:hypothetical protein
MGKIVSNCNYSWGVRVQIIDLYLFLYFLYFLFFDQMRNKQTVSALMISHLTVNDELQHYWFDFNRLLFNWKCHLHHFEHFTYFLIKRTQTVSYWNHEAFRNKKERKFMAEAYILGIKIYKNITNYKRRYGGVR